MSPGRPFWAGFTAGTANMVTLFAMDKASFTANDISINNWWVALIASLFVGAAVYGREKLADAKRRNGTMPP